MEFSRVLLRSDSKLAFERALPWFHQAYGLEYLSLRYFNAAGADRDGDFGEDHNPETHLIPLVLDAAAGRRHEVKIFGTDYPTPDGRSEERRVWKKRRYRVSPY